MNFIDMTDQVKISWPQRWVDIYEFIDTAMESTKFPLRIIRASNESEINDELYNDEVLRL